MPQYTEHCSVYGRLEWGLRLLELALFELGAGIVQLRTNIHFCKTINEEVEYLNAAHSWNDLICSL
jgi:hypothetical protein